MNGQTMNRAKEDIVHHEQYKLRPTDEEDRVFVITRTSDPEESLVPNVGYCTLKDIKGWILEDMFYENTYFGDSNESLKDMLIDSSNTILLFRNPDTDERMMYCIQSDPENNSAGYIGQTLLDKELKEVSLNERN
jgi:hypothetical protein|tara:strand:- start:273 stop:677 length:405 start_codon:yes stop_codon:yes gene_type:complete